VKISGHRRDETIAATGNRFNVSRFFGIVCERGPDLLLAKVDTALEVDERIVTPEAMLDLFPGHDLAGTFDKQRKHSERLRMHFYGNTGFAQSAACGVQFVGTESNYRWGPSWRSH
jgi:hypothetical protein